MLLSGFWKISIFSVVSNQNTFAPKYLCTSEKSGNFHIIGASVFLVDRSAQETPESERGDFFLSPECRVIAQLQVAAKLQLFKVGP